MLWSRSEAARNEKGLAWNELAPVVFTCVSEEPSHIKYHKSNSQQQNEFNKTHNFATLTPYTDIF